MIEDVHWIDAVSEAMFAQFAAVVPQTRSLMLVTFRPEYRGALDTLPNSHRIALAPLDDSESTALAAELLGSDGSVAALTSQVAERAAGNPFFAEELVRDLAERGVWTADPATTCVGATPPTCGCPHPCKQPLPPASIAFPRLRNEP